MMSKLDSMLAATICLERNGTFAARPFVCLSVWLPVSLLVQQVARKRKLDTLYGALITWPAACDLYASERA